MVKQKFVFTCCSPKTSVKKLEGVIDSEEVDTEKDFNRCEKKGYTKGYLAKDMYVGNQTKKSILCQRREIHIT